MANSTTPRQMLLIGAGAAAVGTYFFLVGVGLLPIPGGPRNLHGPLWLVQCIGVAILLAAVAMFVQAIGHANDSGELPADAPRWLRVVQWLLGVAIFACFGAIASWIAFGPGERAFSGSFLFFGPAGNAAIGRALFGAGAIIIWLCTLAVAVAGFRRIVRRSS